MSKVGLYDDIKFREVEKEFRKAKDLD